MITLHGANIVAKTPPYDPAAFGIGEDDAAFLQSVGFNAIRLGVIYTAVEPQPGAYDDAYLERIANTVETFRQHGIYSLLDFHQDQYNEKYAGQGFPDWASIDDGQPNTAAVFPAGYLSNPALLRAEDNFWNNKAGPGGVGLQDRYAAAWAHVAARFRGVPGIMGYDIINEPSPGLEDGVQCFTPLGCEAFDRDKLGGLYRKVIAAIRTVDAATLIHYEANIVYDYLSPSLIPALGDPNLVFGYHPYYYPDKLARANDAQTVADRNNAPAFISEGPDVSAADTSMQGWTYWGYWSNGQTGPAYTIKDPSKPPAGDNLDMASLSSYIRPFPRAVAGTPQSWAFDTNTKTFTLQFKTIRPDGKPYPEGISEIVTPPYVYTNGYALDLVGARVVCGTNSQRLLIRTNPGTQDVTVRITPGATVPTAGDCG